MAHVSAQACRRWSSAASVPPLSSRRSLDASGPSFAGLFFGFPGVCAVLSDCRRDAVRAGERSGVRGGLADSERRRVGSGYGGQYAGADRDDGV
ncbi:WhiB family transcriptional regulator [Parafrankia sp. FMc2]|uniref:WhiB family transcriptional regulator n=1 Tax=Parafrankia sp. FMc2 TaxID=3233196 RepID=UPI0034D3DB8E